MDRHPRPAIDDERDARSLLGEELADHELVGAPRLGETCGCRPVDVRGEVAGPVGTSPRDLVAVTPARGATAAELNTEEATPRDKREGPRGLRAHVLAARASRSQSGSGRGALFTALAKTRSIACCRVRSSSNMRSGATTRRWPSTGRKSSLDVLRGDERPAVQQRPGARDALECERPADGGADLHDLELACGAHEVDDPSLEERIDVHLLDGGVQRLELGEVDDGAQPAQRMAVQLIVEDAQLVLGVRIAERGPQQEPVELRLWERERPLLLDRVLGRDQKERIGETTRNAVDRHLLLGHRLEQRRLRLGQRPVHLVDEEDVREHRTGAKLELARLRVPDREAGDVGRLEVGRALDP